MSAGVLALCAARRRRAEFVVANAAARGDPWLHCIDPVVELPARLAAAGLVLAAPPQGPAACEAEVLAPLGRFGPGWRRPVAVERVAVAVLQTAEDASE